MQFSSGLSSLLSVAMPSAGGDWVHGCASGSHPRLLVDPQHCVGAVAVRRLGETCLALHTCCMHGTRWMPFIAHYRTAVTRAIVVAMYACCRRLAVPLLQYCIYGRFAGGCCAVRAADADWPVRGRGRVQDSRVRGAGLPWVRHQTRPALMFVQASAWCQHPTSICMRFARRCGVLIVWSPVD